MKEKIIKNLLLLILWIITIIFTSVWVYENPETVEILKNYFKKNKIVKANSFNIKIDKIISLSERTAFILYEKNFSKFNPSLMKIFTHDGYIIENSKSQKFSIEISIANFEILKIPHENFQNRDRKFCHPKIIFSTGNF